MWCVEWVDKNGTTVYRRVVENRRLAAEYAEKGKLKGHMPYLWDLWESKCKA